MNNTVDYDEDLRKDDRQKQVPFMKKLEKKLEDIAKAVHCNIVSFKLLIKLDGYQDTLQ